MNFGSSTFIYYLRLDRAVTQWQGSNKILNIVAIPVKSIFNYFLSVTMLKRIQWLQGVPNNIYLTSSPPMVSTKFKDKWVHRISAHTVIKWGGIYSWKIYSYKLRKGLCWNGPSVTFLFTSLQARYVHWSNPEASQTKCLLILLAFGEWIYIIVWKCYVWSILVFWICNLPGYVPETQKLFQTLDKPHNQSVLYYMSGN